MLENRILEVFNQSNLSRQEFANKLNISNAVLSHISSGRNKASLDLVLNLLNAFPHINPEWLILGKGDMLISNKENELKRFKDQLNMKIDSLIISNKKLQDELLLMKSELNDLQ